jgi:hypothetical protein
VGSETTNWTVKVKDKTRFTATEIHETVKYAQMDYRGNEDILKRTGNRTYIVKHFEIYK